MKSIDLNCDMGESFGLWTMGQDADMMPHITSANIACGAHAGDPSVMAATVALARRYDVAVGAHPGYPDLQGFGRRPLRMLPQELKNMILYQLGALSAIARSQGVEISHVKPHGALYNVACSDNETARAVVEALIAFSTSVPVYCLPGSALEDTAHERGAKSISEGFVDRAYQPNGSLVDRSAANSLLGSPAQAVEQAVRLASGSVICASGAEIRLNVQTLCVHGDTPGAAAIAKAVRAALSRAGFRVTAVGHGQG